MVEVVSPTPNRDPLTHTLPLLLWQEREAAMQALAEDRAAGLTAELERCSAELKETRKAATDAQAQARAAENALEVQQHMRRCGCGCTWHGLTQRWHCRLAPRLPSARLQTPSATLGRKWRACRLASTSSRLEWRRSKRKLPLYDSCTWWEQCVLMCNQAEQCPPDVLQLRTQRTDADRARRAAWHQRDTAEVAHSRALDALKTEVESLKDGVASSEAGRRTAEEAAKKAEERAAAAEQRSVVERAARVEAARAATEAAREARAAAARDAAAAAKEAQQAVEAAEKRAQVSVHNSNRAHKMPVLNTHNRTTGGGSGRCGSTTSSSAC